MSPEDVRAIVRAVEDGWRGTLEEVRRGERERMQAVTARVRLLTRALLVIVATTIASVSLGLAALSSQASDLANVVAEQQKSREAALVDRCRQTNDLTTGMRSFIRQVSPKLLPLAEHKFKVIANCERYARRLLKP